MAKRGVCWGVWVMCLIVFLTGCGQIGEGRENMPEIAAKFTCQVEIETDTVSLGGTLEVKESGMYQMTVSYPETVSQMSVSFNGEGFDCNYRGISRNFGAELLKESCWAFLFDALTASRGKDALELREAGEEQNVFLGENGHGNFQISLDKKGYIWEIIYLDQNVHIRFSDYQ